jgi:hypothetical protein
MEQKIHELNENELLWIQAQLSFASSFVDAYAFNEDHHAVNLSVLDKAFAAWIETNPTDVGLINHVINAVGIAFGNHLVEGLGMKWVIATDDQGADLVVYGLPSTRKVLVYPANFVAKRWERKEVNFLESSYRLIEDQVRR